jgi:hypothetical protein
MRPRTLNPDQRAGYKVRDVWVFYEDSDLGSQCALWQGSTSLRGYPIRGDGRGGLSRVHREVYERANGPIPADHQIHHLCGHTNCLTVAHMEALSDLEHAAKHRTFDYEEAASLRRQGWSYREIGRAVGASRGAVQRAISRMAERGEF